MFNAHFDEADTGTIYFIAGWVAAAEEWAKFSHAWNAVLASPPAIKYFSHHEAKSAKGEFSGWSKAHVDGKIDALVQVICDHEMYGVEGGLNLKTWHAVFTSKVLTKKQQSSVLKFTHPYQSCFHGVVSAVLQLQLEHDEVDAAVDFVFDEQCGLLKKSIKDYETFRKTFPPEKQKIAGTIASGDDKQLPPLQAADLLCGKIVTNLHIGKPEKHFRRLVECHQVHHFKAYPPNFQLTPALVKALDVIWSEKQRLDKEIAEEEQNRSGEKTDDPEPKRS